MSRKTKYKSVGVSDETYEMIVEIAKREKRNISQQLAMIVEEEYIKKGMSVPATYSGGITIALDD